MATVNQVLGDAGAGHTETIAGRRLTLKPMTGERQAIFEDWLENRAIEAAERTAERLRKKARHARERYRELQKASTGKISPEEYGAIEVEMRELAAESRALDHDAEAQIDKTNDKIAAGFYGYLSDIAQSSLGTFDGSVTLIHAMLQPQHPEISRDAVAELYRVEENREPLHKAIRHAEGLAGRPTSGATTTTLTTTTPSA